MTEVTSVRRCFINRLYKEIHSYWSSFEYDVTEYDVTDYLQDKCLSKYESEEYDLSWTDDLAEFISSKRAGIFWIDEDLYGFIMDYILSDQDKISA